MNKKLFEQDLEKQATQRDLEILKKSKEFSKKQESISKLNEKLNEQARKKAQTQKDLDLLKKEDFRAKAIKELEAENKSIIDTFKKDIEKDVKKLVKYDKELEINIKSIDTEIKTENTKVNKLEDKITKLENSIPNAKHGEVSEIRQKIKELQTEVKNKDKALTDLQNQKHKLDQEIKSNKFDIQKRKEVLLKEDLNIDAIRKINRNRAFAESIDKQIDDPFKERLKPFLKKKKEAEATGSNELRAKAERELLGESETILTEKQGKLQAADEAIEGGFTGKLRPYIAEIRKEIPIVKARIAGIKDRIKRLEAGEDVSAFVDYKSQVITPTPRTQFGKKLEIGGNKTVDIIEQIKKKPELIPKSAVKAKQIDDFFKILQLLELKFKGSISKFDEIPEWSSTLHMKYDDVMNKYDWVHDINIAKKRIADAKHVDELFAIDPNYIAQKIRERNATPPPSF